MASPEAEGQKSAKSSIKKPRYSNTFSPTWTQEFGNIIKPSTLGKEHAYCPHCNCHFKIAHRGVTDVRRHLDTEKHAKASRAVTGTNTLSLAMYQNALFAESVIRAEVLMQGFVLEHNLPIAVGDHFTKLAPVLFPDSKIARSYACGRTKSTHIIAAVARESVQKVRAELSVCGSGSRDQPAAAAAVSSSSSLPPDDRSRRWFSLATDG